MLTGPLDPRQAHAILRSLAFERGLATTTDLTEWDYWPHVARPIDDVRRELNIVPRAERPRG